MNHDEADLAAAGWKKVGSLWQLFNKDVRIQGCSLAQAIELQKALADGSLNVRSGDNAGI